VRVAGEHDDSAAAERKAGIIGWLAEKWPAARVEYDTRPRQEYVARYVPEGFYGMRLSERASLVAQRSEEIESPMRFHGADLEADGCVPRSAIEYAKSVARPGHELASLRPVVGGLERF